MPYLEFPKAVYLDGDVTRESTIVHNEHDEAAAKRRGFQALPANPPPEALQPGGPDHLPYPKMLYIDGKIDGDTRVVKDADEEAVAASDGFVALGVVSEDLTAKDAIAAIRTSTDIAALEAASETETRSTVLDAIEARLAKLKPFDGLSAADAIEAIEASTDVVALQLAAGLDTRKTVLAAIEARLAELAAR